MKDTFNPEKPRPKLISKETKTKTTKNPTEHTYTQIKIPVRKLFKEQYSEEMILTHLSENALNEQPNDALV